jgi:hypothetical protein
MKVSRGRPERSVAKSKGGEVGAGALPGGLPPLLSKSTFLFFSTLHQGRGLPSKSCPVSDRIRRALEEPRGPVKSHIMIIYMKAVLQMSPFS